LRFSLKARRNSGLKIKIRILFIKMWLFTKSLLFVLLFQFLSCQGFVEYLSFSSSNLAATNLQTTAFFAGGINDSLCVPSMDTYSSSAGSLPQPSSPLSLARLWLTATSVNDLVLFAGGSTSNSTFTPSDRVDIWNATSNAWAPTASLSTARAWLTSTTVADLAIFAGGKNNFASDAVDIYNATSQEWTVSYFSEPRFQLAAASTPELAFFAGGTSRLNSTYDVSMLVDIYNPATQTWSISALSMARRELAGAAVGNAVLFAGGIDEHGDPTDLVDIYEADSKDWGTAKLSIARSFLAAAEAGKCVLFAGGLDSDGAPSNAVDVYHTTTRSWTTLSLSQARSSLVGAAVAIENGYVALFAGGSAQEGASNVIDGFTCCDDGTISTEHVACSAVPTTTGSTTGTHSDEPKHSSLPFIVISLVAAGITMIVVGTAVFIYITKRKQFQANTQVNTEEDK
jgi:hypothetical protein